MQRNETLFWIVLKVEPDPYSDPYMITDCIQLFSVVACFFVFFIIILLSVFVNCIPLKERMTTKQIFVFRILYVKSYGIDYKYLLFTCHHSLSITGRWGRCAYCFLGFFFYIFHLLNSELILHIPVNNRTCTQKSYLNKFTYSWTRHMYQW